MMQKLFKYKYYILKSKRHTHTNYTILFEHVMFISRLLVFTINKDINSFSFFWVFFWQDSIVGTLFDNNSTFSEYLIN